jgi:hypothetical protein
MTLKELRALNHDIYVHFRDELCRVVVEGSDRYLLSNNDDYDGNCPDNMYGYAYGWWLCNDRKSDDELFHRYLKPTKRRPL